MTKVTVSLLKVGPKLFPIMKNIMMDTKNKVIIKLLCSEPKLQFHSLKSFLASNSPYTLFLTFLPKNIGTDTKK